MLGLLLCLVSGAAAPFLQLSVQEADGRESPARAAALSRALLVSWATVVLGAESRDRCGTGCVQVTVRESGAGRFEIAASQGGRQATRVVELPVSLPPFDEARALALRTRQVVDALALTPPTGLVQSGRAEVAAPAAPPERLGPDPQPAPSPELPAAHAAASPEEVPALEEPVAFVAAPPRRDPVDRQRWPEVLSLDVAVVVLTSLRGSELTTGGVQAMFRARTSRYFEAQATYALLYGPAGWDAQGPFVQTPVPSSVAFALLLPHHPELSFALGVESVLVYVTHPAELDPSRTNGYLLTAGAIGRLGYRYQRPGFSLVSSVGLSVQPIQGSLGDSLEAYRYPMWTFSATMGIGFRLF